MKYLRLIVLLLFAIPTFAQSDIEQNDWYARHGSEIYYGLSGFSISSFLKVEDGILIYSHQKGELLYLNNEHLRVKSWNIKVRAPLLNSPDVYA